MAKTAFEKMTRNLFFIMEKFFLLFSLDGIDDPVSGASHVDTVVKRLRQGNGRDGLSFCDFMSQTLIYARCRLIYAWIAFIIQVKKYSDF